MKISQRGLADADLSQLVRNDKAIDQSTKAADAKPASAGASSTVRISQQARDLQKIAELAHTGDELRAEKVRQIKEQIDGGTYNPDAVEVAKSILRTEVGSLLEKK